MKKRKCSRCGELKTEKHYYPKKGYCKECHRAYVAHRYAILKDDLRPYYRAKKKGFRRPWFRESPRRAMAYAWVRRNAIERPKECSLCREEARRIVAHHPDYRRIKHVIFVCDPCHTRIHRERRMR